MAAPPLATQISVNNSFVLTASHDVAVVFGSLAAQSCARFCDTVVVEINDDGARLQLTVPTHDTTGVGRPALRAELKVPIPTPDLGPDEVTGVVAFGWTNTRPTEAAELLARSLTAQAVSILAWRRSEQRAREIATKAENLQIALASSRQIGAAIGIVMSQAKVTTEDAFALLRQVSQHQHRKIHDIALDVLDTGWLDPELVPPIDYSTDRDRTGHTMSDTKLIIVVGRPVPEQRASA